MVTLKRLGKSVKDAWHIVGIIILLLCFLEGSLSLAFRIKDGLRRSPPERRVAAPAERPNAPSMARLP